MLMEYRDSGLEYPAGLTEIYSSFRQFEGFILAALKA